MSTRTFLSLVLALAASVAANAQSQRPVVFTNARIITVAGEVIESGTLVMRAGKIEAVGADVTPPAGAKIIDAAGRTIMPGLVSAFSRAGLTQARPTVVESRPGRRRRGFPRTTPSSRSSAQNKAATKVIDGLYPKQKVFGELLEAGVTSLALTPIGSAFPGTGALLAPDGKTIAELTANDAAFVQIGMQRDSQTKKLLKDNFEKAGKIVEERKRPKTPPAPDKPAAETKKPEAKPAENNKGAEQAKEPPKPGPAPRQEPKAATPAAEKAPPSRPQKKDPNLELLADLLEGKQRAIVQIDSAADLLHWQHAVKDDVKFSRTVVVTRHDPFSGTVDETLDQLKRLECSVLLPAATSTKGRSRHLTNPAKTLHDAGIEIGFVIGDNAASARGLFFQLMELVRCGLPADVALRGVTLVPAKALGIDGSVGTIEAGKDANLIVFDGDPLSPQGRIDSIWFRGRAVDLSSN